MARNTTTSTTNQSASVSPEAIEISRLLCAVTDMGDMVHSELPKIVGLAKLALAAMETPAAHQHPEMIAQALRSIWGIAEQAYELIGCEAENAGYRCDDAGMIRRYEAAGKAKRGVAA